MNIIFCTLTFVFNWLYLIGYWYMLMIKCIVYIYYWQFVFQRTMFKKLCNFSKFLTIIYIYSLFCIVYLDKLLYGELLSTIHFCYITRMYLHNILNKEFIIQYETYYIKQDSLNCGVCDCNVQNYIYIL